MDERDVTRNGRGQIVSYEIDGVYDSNEETSQYGKVFLPTMDDAYGATKSEKLNRQSLIQTIDTSFSDELLIPTTTISPQININEILQESDYTESNTTTSDNNDDDNNGPSGPSGGGGGGSPRD